MKKVRKRSDKLGLPPGSAVAVGEHNGAEGTRRLFVYDHESYSEGSLTSLADLRIPEPTGKVSWLDIDGMGQDDMVPRVGEHFGLHPLLIEDALNTDHRPKVEEYQDNLFVVVKMLALNAQREIEHEQVSFVLGKGYVISFQEKPGDVLDPIRERIRQKLGRVRKMGADYLLYALLDVIVDNYFLIVEDLGQRIETIETNIAERNRPADLRSIQELRSQLISVSRYVTPTRELAGRLAVMQSDLLEDGIRRYINDLQDHTVYIAETISTFREMLNGLENAYHANLNLRSGQVMKLLAIISTIFMPLTFIVGIYGMNFDYMPELRWPNGYFIVLGTMSAVVASMLAWFRWKKWL
jgi:magnesium transporter